MRAVECLKASGPVSVRDFAGDETARLADQVIAAGVDVTEEPGAMKFGLYDDGNADRRRVLDSGGEQPV
jgi:hypothetical protein